MKVVKTIKELRQQLPEEESKNKTVGFVPTMGALHRGHLSLVQRCSRECGVTVVSIFVNPTQFNDKADLARYPRTLEADVKLLQATGCDVVFAPDEKEIYPQPDTRLFDFGLLEKVMEGERRNGHFNGVAQVVSRLFDAVKPSCAYFGEKDFQQIAIVSEMIRQLGLPVEIVRCPIVREPDGLAMSSRNALLTPDQRAAAPLIAKTLFAAVDKVCSADLPALKQFVADAISASEQLRLDYFEVVCARTLQPVASLDDDCAKQACIAVYAGEVRLIDNVRLA
ncbi:MAG: pantoate--beta-alanine ligase [Prevotellaceae bacterium]|jgi:pantoate--beta-alanine ligase|nr:pantoate--beta-alanine ligase [Prevotellaceae bacterium]